MAYDRYSRFRTGGTIKIVPSIKLPVKSTDYYETYKLGISRLDLMSYDAYGDPNYDWLIMMANPEYGAMEFEIPDGAELRIQYPLSTTIENYNTLISQYEELYGLKEIR